ncbi:acetate kinase [Aetokthonos hydrillicola Thurmond2011]|jgi:acetate kinase|uniref:Acetate kinase n=1 Tax=Aetokthonos hydrillicola Thurmond2011 TaxID=2712845 RepID=A0AAP5I9U9_9CYAN|nr:acetate kinase [Aetokthonos hydrillicola]MBO3460214.1 acetate kinase [Aetokthonos hydrillicola CCALA 1050]MBW4586947.1 acetate kinase [Aetokthonos hydrillicola CCALA 1050]MDR9897578.1 acetate kinase [Aetokthonos hydrillicola Thurmond2011]
MKILVLNAGSSSQKSCLYEMPEEAIVEEAIAPLWEAKVDWTHHEGMAEIEVKTSTGQKLQEEIPAKSRGEIIAHMLDTLWNGSTQVISKPSEIDGVGHRVVHGGEDYRESVVITEDVKDAIARLANLAPVHNPVNLEGIQAIDDYLGQVKQVAVFDTAFHSSLPDAAAIYPGPYDWVEKGIRRYGFHGISHQYCAQRAAHLLNKDLESLRLITCHLGNGCSLAAIKNGRSIETTMGFTPLDGLMMGTRSGSVDPGILIYLLQQSDDSAQNLDNLLNRASGLLGISGVSGDMRQIQKAIAQGNPRAQLAWDIYIHRLRYYIGAMLAILQGLDVLVFTAGVGENAPDIRAATCEAFGFLGLHIDPEKNQHKPIDIDIATPDSKVRVLVIHTQEDWAIAQECWRHLQ